MSAMIIRPEDPGREVSRMAADYRRQHPEAGLTFREALEVVRSTDEGVRLFASYNARARVRLAHAQKCPEAEPELTPTRSRSEIDNLVDSKAVALMDKDAKLDYAAAVRTVLTTDPRLAVRYAAARHGEIAR